MSVCSSLFYVKESVLPPSAFHSGRSHFQTAINFYLALRCHFQAEIFITPALLLPLILWGEGWGEELGRHCESAT